jgi:hypothetical protein
MTKTKIKNYLHKVVSGAIILTILFTQFLSAPVASAQFGGLFSNQNPETKLISLVAVLVEEDLIQDNNEYDGLNSSQWSGNLGSKTFRDRITRFAKDVQMSDPYTESIILRVSEDQTPYEISQALETLYYKGDEAISDNSRLAGVITIGDVPLPVVNKNGYRFISMLPYTDFENKSYIFDLNSRNFEYNADISEPKVEAWHGVIKPSKPDLDGKNQLAEYFDKNHLYHIGHSDFITYDQEVLYGDIIWEQELLNETMLTKYNNYAEHLEDFAYYRYTKELLKELIDSPELEGLVDPSMFEGLPDVQSRTVIKSYAIQFNELYKNYLQKANDLIKGSGRWDEFDSLVEVISAKDLYTQEYLRQVNDQIEEKVDELAFALQEPFIFIEDASISGTLTLDNNSNVILNTWDFINNNKFLYNAFK